MDISSQEIAGSSCGTVSSKVEWNVRNWVNKETDDGHRVSGLRVLGKKNVKYEVWMIKTIILSNMEIVTVSLPRW
jgi:hypothetical protein